MTSARGTASRHDTVLPDGEGANFAVSPDGEGANFASAGEPAPSGNRSDKESRSAD